MVKNVGTWSCSFSFSSWITMASSLKKKTKVKLYLLTDTDMLIMIEKYISVGICDSIYWYAKVSNKYLEDYNKNQESRYLNIGMQIICMVGKCRKTFPKIILSGSKTLLNLMKISYGILTKKVMKDIFLKLIFNTLKIYVILAMIYHFYLKEWRLKKSKSL